MFSSDSVGFVRDAVFHHTSGALWMLEDTAPHRLVALDPTTGQTSQITSSVDQPDLASMFSGEVRMVDATAPDGGGFVVYWYPWPSWASPSQYPSSGPQSFPAGALVMQDKDLDGSAEHVYGALLSDIAIVLEHAAHSDPAYH